MKKVDLSQIISVLANIGVVGGLIFVGMQLEQDRELAAIDRRLALADSQKYWAELLTQNAEVWAKGLSGEILTAAESLAFGSLAEAQDADWFFDWANLGSEAFSVGNDYLAGDLRQAVVRRAAREYYSNPGLLNWYRKYQDQLRETGQFGPFEELINEEIDRLLAELNPE